VLKRLRILLHAALVMTITLPVFKVGRWTPAWFDPEFRPADYGNAVFPGYSYRPVECYLQTTQFLPSVAAAGVPGLLALLNLPLLFGLKGASGARWQAWSSLALGLVSASMLAQLLPRYGDGQTFGGWVIWGVSALLTLAGAAAVARLQPATAPLPAIRNS
jgi:hypothetical protein